MHANRIIPGGGIPDAAGVSSPRPALRSARRAAMFPERPWCSRLQFEGAGPTGAPTSLRIQRARAVLHDVSGAVSWKRIPSDPEAQPERRRESRSALILLYDVAVR